MKRRTKVWFHISNFINNRPLCLLSTLSGARDVIIGLGFLLSTIQIHNSQLYKNYDELIAGYSGEWAGFLFVGAGLITMILAIIDHTKWVRVSLRFQALLWLFSGIMYAMDDNWVFALALGFYFSIVSGYLAYYYKYAPLWAQQKRQFRDEFIAKHDPLTHITDRARM